MHVMYYALRVGFLDDIVIGCMVVPLPYAFLVIEVFPFLRLDVLCLVIAIDRRRLVGPTRM
jgi:hypothetical protein